MNIRLTLLLSLLCASAASAGVVTFTFSPAGTGSLHYEIVGGASGDIVDTNSDGSETLTVADFSFLNVYFVNVSSSVTVSKVVHDSSTIHDPPGTVLNASTLPGYNGYIDATFITGNTTYDITYSSGGGGTTPEIPVGTFNFAAPTDGSVTPITSAGGSYSGSMATRLFLFDVTADDEGKLSGLGTVEGVSATQTNSGQSVASVAPPALTQDIPFTGSLSTGKDGKPSAKLDMKVTGDFQGNEMKTSLSATGGFSDSGTFSNSISGSTQAGTQKVSVKKLSLPVQAPADAKAQSWVFDLTFAKQTNAKGKSYATASVLLTLPGGEQVSFPAIVAKFTAKKGYTLSFTKGQKLDSGGQPQLDGKGKPILDKKSSLKITNLTFQKSANQWSVTDGDIAYSLLGQKGSGQLSKF